jgi:RadC-like JAB domain-containing protein
LSLDTPFASEFFRSYRYERSKPNFLQDAFLGTVSPATRYWKHVAGNKDPFSSCRKLSDNEHSHNEHTHFHSSGDPTPSPEDIAVREQLVEASKVLDIDLLDHLVIGNHRFVSLKERLRW